MSRHRADFGSIRRLSSGRWQVRHRDPDGQVRNAPHTFATRADASAYLAQLRTNLRRGEWADVTAGRISLSEYAATWLDHRRVRGMPLAPERRSCTPDCLPTTSSPSSATWNCAAWTPRECGRGTAGSREPPVPAPAQSRSSTACCTPSARPPLARRRSAATPAFCPGQARNRSQREPHSASKRSSRSLRQFLRVGAHWSFSPRTAVSASASWQPFAVITSTWSGQ